MSWPLVWRRGSGRTRGLCVRDAASLCLAAVATLVPVFVWRAFVERREQPGRLVVAFLLLGLGAVAVGGVHRRSLGWLGVGGTGTMAIGAVLAAWAVHADDAAGDLGDGVWRAHFLIMAGSLVAAAGAARSARLSRPVAAGAFLASWAFLGAWGVGLAWLAWALLAARRPSTAGPGGEQHVPESPVGETAT